jgi:hypothetical protein
VGGTPEEGVGLDLVDGGRDVVVLDEIEQAVRVEVGHADRTGFP